MLLENGRWRGRGTLLADGQSRGLPIECTVQVERDPAGVTLTGHYLEQGAGERDLAVRIAANDVGTYTLSVTLNGEMLQGTAKLDSPPNLGLLWNDSGSVNATFALFAVARGYGFRGFLRHAGLGGARTEPHLFTWEVAFTLEQDVVRGGNVVSLTRRRR